MENLPEAPKVSFWERYKKFILIAAGVAVALLASIGFLMSERLTRHIENGTANNAGTVKNGIILDLHDEFTIAPTALGELVILPLSASNLGIEVDSSFIISSDVITLTEEHLQSFLSVRRSSELSAASADSSSINFTLESQRDGSFLLYLDEVLTNDSIYNIIYSPPESHPLSFAFQTIDIFRITSTTPMNNVHGVPENSGIEITFSQGLSSDSNFSDFFTIDPAVNGRFIVRDNTHIFMPESLSPQTRYTVTIERGIQSEAGETLEEDFTFVFNTQWGTANQPILSIAGDKFETFLPSDNVFIELNASSDFAAGKFRVDVYDLETPERFINFDPITDSISPNFLVETFELELYELYTGGWRNHHYLFLNQTLPEGYYLAVITTIHNNREITLHKFIQVSPISVYSLSISGQTCFWVHNTNTGEPAVGATITVDGRTATTNSEGIAIIETRASSRASTIIEYRNYLPFAYIQTTFARGVFSPGERFLSYMYTDRSSYRPTDTVDIFGVIKPRPGHSLSADDVITLHLGDMLEIPIELDEYRSFNMRVPVTNMRGFLTIGVNVNGERLMSRHVNFLDYANLSYVLSGELDRRAYFIGDSAGVEIHVVTFSEAPVEGLTLRGTETSLTTDQHGVASGEIPISREHWSNNWEPFWSWFSFHVVSESQTSQSIHLPVILLPSDIMLEVEYEGGSSATFTSNRIDIDRIETHYADAPAHITLDRDVYRGASVDVDFTIEVTRFITTRTVRSQTYDHIQRRTITIYDHNTVEEHYRTITARTINGHAIVDNIPYSSDPLISYRLQVNFNDSQGRPVRFYMFNQGWPSFRQESSIRHFSLTMDNRSMRIGETSLVSLLEVDDPWWGWGEGNPVTEGRLLAILARDEILSTSVGSPAGVPITFTESCISNAFVFGAYFDGRYIFPVAMPFTVFYDSSERKLNIQVEFDQDNYRPGDEVTATVRVTGSNDIPVTALVCISVVDESSILNPWHTADFLDSLYRSSMVDTWTYNFSFFASHTQRNFGGGGTGAEMGGDGDAGYGRTIRSNFVDNPVFETVETDANGVGQITFTLPDSVTSWRVTTLAITKDGHAGDTVDSIISALPFFIDIIHTNEYIIGDEIGALIRPFGENFRRNHTNVNFTFEILQDDAVVFSDSQTAAGNVTFNAGRLDIGDYIMRVFAATGSDSDAMERPFTVTETGMRLPIRTMQQISADSPELREFHMLNLPVTVTLTNGNIRPLVNILNNTRDSRSFRTDQMAATAFAEHFFRSIWNSKEEVHDFAANVRAQIHTHSGGIPQLTYEDADFFYTARFAASFPEFVNRDRIVSYVHRELEIEPHNTIRRAAGLLALAAAGEPVLLRIQEEIDLISYSQDQIQVIVSSNGYMRVLYLAAALCALGDDSGAYELMQRFQPSHDMQANPSDRETINALLLYINTTINPQAAWQYLRNKEPNAFVSDIPERINFVRRVYVMGDTVSEVKYTLNGITHTAKLSNFERLTLNITRDQYDSLGLISIQGTTDLFIDFYSYNVLDLNPEEELISITKSIVRAEELYRVDFNVTFLPGATPGFFTIHDRLPSNMRFVPVTRRHDLMPGLEWSHARNTERQSVEIGFFAQTTTPRIVSYYAMKLFEAESELGMAYISNGNVQNHIWGVVR